MKPSAIDVNGSCGRPRSFRCGSELSAPSSARLRGAVQVQRDATREVGDVELVRIPEPGARERRQHEEEEQRQSERRSRAAPRRARSASSEVSRSSRARRLGDRAPSRLRVRVRRFGDRVLVRLRVAPRARLGRVARGVLRSSRTTSARLALTSACRIRPWELRRRPGRTAPNLPRLPADLRKDRSGVWYCSPPRWPRRRSTPGQSADLDRSRGHDRARRAAERRQEHPAERAPRRAHRDHEPSSADDARPDRRDPDARGRPVRLPRHPGSPQREDTSSASA